MWHLQVHLDPLHMIGNSMFEDLFSFPKVACMWLTLASIVCISFVEKGNPRMHCFKLCGREENPRIADNAR